MLTSAKSGNSRLSVLIKSFKSRISSCASRKPNLSSISLFQELGSPQDEGNFLGAILLVAMRSGVAAELGSKTSGTGVGFRQAIKTMEVTAARDERLAAPVSVRSSTVCHPSVKVEVIGGCFVLCGIWFLYHFTRLAQPRLHISTPNFGQLTFRQR